ncbi:MAG: tetratricopeptide repeat protein [Caldilineaceae bacterium]|nr:tetratricopeptide repeat protein [Caldilineaceae bacterium]
MNNATGENHPAESFDWYNHWLERFQYEAERAILLAQRNELDHEFIQTILVLLRNYVETPGVGDYSQPADEKILRLAQLIISRIRRMGYWQDMNYLWPKLCAIAEHIENANLYVIFFKFMATAKGYVGNVNEELAAYSQLINHPRFQDVTPTLQANVLITYATALVWRGQRDIAAQLLQACLALTDVASPWHQGQHGQAAAEHRLELGNTPLWETRSTVLNQRGVLHMFCGEFALAYRYFDEMSIIFQQHSEDDNLACIAHQAVGRLLLYEKRYSEALDLLTQGLVIRRRWIDREGIAVNSIYIAAAHIGLYQLDAAEEFLNEALKICHDLNTQHDLALCHLYFGMLARRRGQPEQVNYHWYELVTVAKRVVVHFVELRMLLPEVRSLHAAHNSLLYSALLRTLWQSKQHDQLTFDELRSFSKI